MELDSRFRGFLGLVGGVDRGVVLCEFATPRVPNTPSSVFRLGFAMTYESFVRCFCCFVVSKKIWACTKIVAGSKRTRPQVQGKLFFKVLKSMSQRVPSH